MMTPNRRHILLAATILLSGASVVSAQEGFESLVRKLADDSYAVRMEAKQALTEMCRKHPALIDKLAPVVFDEEDEIERVLLAREVVADAIYVERGAIGFALDMKLVVDRMENNKPAQQSGIEVGWQLLAVRGKPVEGMTPDQVYVFVHATRPGTDIEMEFLTKEGKKVVCRPITVARASIRSDENPSERRKQLYEEWLERKGRELQED